MITGNLIARLTCAIWSVNTFYYNMTVFVSWPTAFGFVLQILRRMKQNSVEVEILAQREVDV